MGRQCVDRRRSIEVREGLEESVWSLLVQRVRCCAGVEKQLRGLSVEGSDQVADSARPSATSTVEREEGGTTEGIGESGGRCGLGRWALERRTHSAALLNCKEGQATSGG